jgi:hypothetical protein
MTKKLLMFCLFTCSALIVALSLQCSWWQKHDTTLDCAAVETVEDAPQLLAIVQACVSVAVSSSAILPCIVAAADSKWATDVLGCFKASVTSAITVPAIERLKR